MEPYHLIVVGIDEIVVNKYMLCIEEAHAKGLLTSYSILDLMSAKAEVQDRIARVSLKPSEIQYIDDSILDSRDPASFSPFFDTLRKHHPNLRAYVATELRAHEPYLRYCIGSNIPTLVEKPVLAPLDNDLFNPSRINEAMSSLISLADLAREGHSVMTLSRYHPVYNDLIVAPLKERMLHWRAPISSLHLRHSGGVWNLPHEFEDRDDHPYKFGYGMMMHGAYHYVDVVAQLLALNCHVLPDRMLDLTIMAMGAFPADQDLRIPMQYAKQLEERSSAARSVLLSRSVFGETDVVAIMKLSDTVSSETVTLGTLAFEQTTPSIRSWGDFPAGVYNKNGRSSVVDLEAQLSTIHSVNARIFDVHDLDSSPDQYNAHARVETRSNGALLIDMPSMTTASLERVAHSDSNRRLMREWLAGTERRSRIGSHRLPMAVTQLILESLRDHGQPKKIAVSRESLEELP